MSIFVRAKFTPRNGRRAEFEELVHALLARSEDEPGTLAYRFFTAGDSYLVLEEYADSAAAARHQQNAADLLTRAFECAELDLIEFYGSVSPLVTSAVPQAMVFPDLGE